MRLERRLETTGKDVIGSFHCQRISRINTILKEAGKIIMVQRQKKSKVRWYFAIAFFIIGVIAYMDDLISHLLHLK